MRSKMTFFFRSFSRLSLVLVISCNNSSFDGQQKSESGIIQGEAPAVALPSPVIPIEQDSSSISEFNYGKPDPAVDYLFIFDNSVSMGPIINNVNSGYSSLFGTGAFPANSKIAVMTTMIADPNNYAAIHSTVRPYEFIANEPGFLDFVDKQSVDAFLALNPSTAANFSTSACVDKWFAPDAVNDQGVSCLLAATQSSFSALVVEAGITAFEQLLRKHAGTKLFRDDALVNVVFVSDTHDPGVNNPDLIAGIASYNELLNLATVDNKLRNLKFHALAPEVQCTAEGTHDLSYFKLVAASGGQKQDPCNIADYKPYLQAMIEASTVDAPRFKLAKPKDLIETVLVDGSKVTEYSISDDGAFLIIASLDPKKPVSVQIIFSDDP